MGNNLHVCYTQWQFYVGEGVSTAFRLSTTTVTWKKNFVTVNHDDDNDDDDDDDEDDDDDHHHHHNHSSFIIIISMSCAVFTGVPTKTEDSFVSAILSGHYIVVCLACCAQ